MPFSKYSNKQKKLARIAEPRDAITGADFAALKKKPKKMAGGGTIASVKKRYDNAIKRKVADVKKRKELIADPSDGFKLDRASQTLKDILKEQTKAIKRGKSYLGIQGVDEQEFKVKDIPTPKI